MPVRALEYVVAEWLPHLGAPVELTPAISRQVSEQLTSLPAPLLAGVSVLGWGLSVLPSGSVGRWARVPGAAEYVRLVRSLATVVYLAGLEGDR